MVSAQDLLKNFNDIKTLPHLEIRLSKLISDRNSTVKEFEETIKLDPTLVLRLLQLVNSAYYGLQQTVNSITRAVVFIGMKKLRNMVITEALKGIFKNSKHEEVFSRNKLWLHCQVVSICGQMISERIFEKNGEDAFLCGILHDVGMIAEDQVVEDLFLQACKVYEPNSKPITEFEREVIGTDHCEVGYLLAQEWNLSVDIQEGVRHHHSPFEELSPSSLTGIIQVAEFIASKMNYTAIPGMIVKLPTPLASHVRDNLNEYNALAKDLPDEIAKAKEVYEIQED